MASSKKIKAVDRARMILNRDERRQARQAKKEANARWHQEKAQAAEVEYLARRSAARNRGLTPAQKRIPKRLDVSDAHRRMWDRMDKERITAPLGVSVVNGRKVGGNHEQRRAAGARGKPRRLRRREMPGAVERRIERNRKAWQ